MRVLLPIDGSDESNEAVIWAANTFPKETTNYFLLNVITVFGDGQDLTLEFSASHELLKEARKKLEKAGCRVINDETLLGIFPSIINNYAKNCAIDQVVLGSHGKSGLKKLFLGSVSETVLETCEKTVIIYRVHRSDEQKLFKQTVENSEIQADSLQPEAALS